MIMDEPFPGGHYSRTWHASPHRMHMSSWDQGSFQDENQLRWGSTTNTPQRDLRAGSNINEDNDANNGPPPMSPYPVGSHPCAFMMEAPHEAPYGFAEFPPSSMAQAYLSPAPYPVQQQRVAYEDCDPDISPPPKVKRTAFDIGPNGTAVNGHDTPNGANKRLKVAHEFHGQGAMNVPQDGSHNMPRYYHHPAQLPSDPYPSAFARSEVPPDTRPYKETYGPPPAKTYVFDDSALSNPNAGEGASPIKKQKAKGPKNKNKKRSKRRAAKKKKKSNGSSPSSSSSSGSDCDIPKFSPSKEEIEAATTPRARDALETWYKRIAELGEYKRKHGDCSVPQKYPDNPSLGTWVNKQRMEYKMFLEGVKHTMTAKKRQNLEALGFDWGKRKGDTAWEQKFTELCEFKQQVGNCQVPTKYKPNPALGRWVSTQRSQYKAFQAGDRSTLTAKRIERLEALGFQWSVLPR